MSRRLLCICTIALLPTMLAAQDPRAAAAAIARARTALAPLAPLSGQWEGEASTMVGPGRTLRIRQSEDITWGASGTVLIVKGTGRGIEGPTAGEVLFEAAALFWFDPDSGRVRMTTHRDGQSVEPSLEFRPDTLVWGFPVPGGRVRYVIAYTNDTWHEVGDFLREGAPAMRTIDLRLKKLRP